MSKKQERIEVTSLLDRHGELSDADLEAVAGGLVDPSTLEEFPFNQTPKPPSGRNIGSAGVTGFSAQFGLLT